MLKNKKDVKMSFNPTNDYIFKRLFGHVGNEEITKALLKAILKKKIEKIDLDKNRILEKDLSSDKLGILDVRATIDNEDDIDIEMQVTDHKDIQERTLFYWSKLFSRKIVSGEDYKDLKKVVIILITKYEIEELKKIEKTLTKWQIREETFPKEVLTNKLEFYILELDKLEKYNDISEELRNWLKFIESPEEIDMSEIKDENIKRAKEELEKINMDEYEQDMALRREMFLHDQASMKRHAYEDGEKAGLEKRKKETGLKSGEKIGLEKRKNRRKDRNSQKFIKK